MFASLVIFIKNNMKRLDSIKTFLIIALVFFTLMLGSSICNAQEITPPDYGLAVSATGISICAIGTTMKTSAVQIYNPKYGYNYINVENPKQARLKLHTLAFGAAFVIAGIVIRNAKKKKK